MRRAAPSVRFSGRYAQSVRVTVLADEFCELIDRVSVTPDALPRMLQHLARRHA
jgi:hypothetical protein